jgi:hypothetical protein
MIRDMLSAIHWLEGNSFEISSKRPNGFSLCETNFKKTLQCTCLESVSICRKDTLDRLLKALHTAPITFR